MFDLIHRLLHFETPAVPGGGGGAEAPAAGTGETPAPPAQQAAEPSTPDRGSEGPPETIPYARFKEVNDQLSELRDYQQFSELGYDPDSLGRLVSLETAFSEDPLGTLAQIIDSTEVLPDGRKAALKELIAVQPTPETPPDGGQTGTGEGTDEPPKWAQPILEDFASRQAADEQAANEAQLDTVIAHWKKLDEEAGITTRDADMLAYIGAATGRPDIQSLEQLAEVARSERIAAREHDLGGAIIRRGEGSPLAVPAGGAARTPPVELKDIKKATQAALADIQGGRLGGAE